MNLNQFISRVATLTVCTTALIFIRPVAADDAGSTPKPSLEERLKTLEQALKDAGVNSGVKGSGIKISGYVDTSYTANLGDRTNNGPVAGSSAQNTNRVFDNQFNSFNLNAVKLVIEKDKANEKFPAGFRVDLMYGEDARVLANPLGAMNDSTLFVEQAYVDLNIPIGNGIVVQVGKQASLIGYELIESGANWNFSRSDAFRLIPATQTGVNFGYKWCDQVYSDISVINGWDSRGSAVNYNTDLSFAGRLECQLIKSECGQLNTFLSGMYGNDMPNPNVAAGTLNSPTSAIIDVGLIWNSPFRCNPFSLGLDYLNRQDDWSGTAAAANVQNQLNQVVANSVNGYAQWDWNKWLSSSARMGYSWYDNAPALGNVNGNISGLTVNSLSTLEQHANMYSFTLTQSIGYWRDTLIRVEWRRDWTDNTRMGFGTATGANTPDDIRQTQDTLALNVIYSF
jgi:hypothetical protein